ncbi:MAG: hypothetical protein AB7T06_00710 [Kofleriaceae bacterium]
MPAAKLNCTVCRRSNNPWRKFCGGCGTAFPNACKCGFVNTADDHFCGGCGGVVRATYRMTPPDNENVTMKIAIDELIPAEK